MQARNSGALEVEPVPPDESPPTPRAAKETVRISVLSSTEADAGAVGKTLPGTDAASANDAARVVANALADMGTVLPN